MPNISEQLSEIRLRIDQASTTTDLIEVSQILLPWLTTEETAQEVANLLVTTFDALKSLTASDESLGEHLILEHLLPLLAKDPNIQSYAASLLRTCLIDWYEQYPEQARIKIRDQSLFYLLQQFNLQPSHEHCLTFARIGYPFEPVFTTLFDYVHSHEPSELVDQALMALATLGCPQEKRDDLLQMVHEHLQDHVSQPLLIAIDRLADATSLSVLVQACHQATDYLRSLSLHVLTTIAETITTIQSPQGTWLVDVTLPDQAWQHIVALYTEDPETFAFRIIMGGDVAPRCDSRDVISHLLQWTEQRAHIQIPFPQVCYRLEECVRPHQLQGWYLATHQEQKVPALNELMHAACHNSGSDGRYATIEMHIKEAAWGTLLRLGIEDALLWFETAVSQETNGYLRGKLATLFACFRLDPLPPTAITWITQPYDAAPTHPSSAELIARMGAIDVVCSAATSQAFEALLHPGLTSQGNTLIASIEAVAEVALALTREGNTGIADMLINSSKQQISFINAYALEALGRHDLLTDKQMNMIIHDLIPLNRDPQEQGLFIAAVGTSEISVSTTFLSQLTQWARERTDEVGKQAIAVLAAHQLLPHDEALFQQLGLTNLGGTWKTMNTSRWNTWQARVLGFLYHPEKIDFLPALESALAELPWQAVDSLIEQLANHHQGLEKIPFPIRLVEPLLRRIQQQQSSMRTDLGLIKRVGELIPEDVAQFPWNHVWEDWMPEARVALADTLGQTALHSSEASMHAEKLLLLLASDRQYAVRRAAYRALAQQHQATLLRICQTWGTSTLRDLRLLAAEACVWLEGSISPENITSMVPGEEALEITLLGNLELEQQLRRDSEPRVRETYSRVHAERQKRLWAQNYLHIILGSKTWSNQDILRLWPYAEAIKRVGDDSIIQEFSHVLSSTTLPPHVRHWYRLILKETSEGWQKALKKWPQPFNSVAAIMEECDAILLLPNGKQMNGL